jgi:hypothetical protein
MWNMTEKSLYPREYLLGLLGYTVLYPLPNVGITNNGFLLYFPYYNIYGEIYNMRETSLPC